MSMELVFKAMLDRSGMTTGLQAIKGQIDTFSNSIKKHGILGTLTAGLSKSNPGISATTGAFGALVGVVGALGAAFGAGMAALSGFVNVMKSAVSSFDHFEQGLLMMARFTGSIEQANRVMKDMDKLGEKLSIPDEQLVGAYTILRLIGGEAMATAENIEKIADAAAAGRGSVEELAQGYAIARANIESGDGMGRFGMRLARSGTISFEGKEAIDQLSKLGQTQKALELFNKEWERFSGASAQRGNTMAGVTVRLKDSFGDLFKELAKPFGGPLIQILDKLADTLQILEPVLKLVGRGIGGILMVINSLAVGFLNAIEGVMAFGNAIEAAFGNEEAGRRLEKRIDSISQRMKKLGDGWNSITTSSLNPDEVRPIDSERNGLKFDESGTEERLKNVAKLEAEIAKLKIQTAEAVLDEEEKLVVLNDQIARQRRETMQKEKAHKEAEKTGETNITSLKQAALESAKTELDLAKKRQDIERKIVEMKRKEAAESAKRAEEIYKAMQGREDERSFDAATHAGKLALNSAKQGELEKQKEANLRERQDLENKADQAYGGAEGKQRLTDLQNAEKEMAKLDIQDTASMTDEELEKHNKKKVEIQADIDFNKEKLKQLGADVTGVVQAGADAALEANKLKGAEIDQDLQKNRHQREDIIKQGSSSVGEASKRQQDYGMEKVFADLKSIYESEKTTEKEKKEAINKEIQLRQSLADKMMREAAELDMLGEKAKAIDMETEAMKMKDAIEALQKSEAYGYTDSASYGDDIRQKRELAEWQQRFQGNRTISEGNIYDKSNLGMAANLMGLQYSAPQQEDTRYLANIDTTMKNVEVAIKANTEALAKPIIVSRFL